MAGISQGFGDIEKIECPDPFNYGKFIEVGQIRGAEERVTTTLEGRYALELKSTLLSLSKKGCAFDAQLHMGACKDPSAFNQFDKALILENVYATSYSTEDLGALASGDDAAVNESADVSAKAIYEVLPLSFGEKASSIITNEVIDIAICGNPSCGDCGTENDGCKKIYAVTAAAGGSPGTAPDVVYSLDKGVSWYAHDIDTMSSTEDPSAVSCVGAYLVVVSNETNSLHYVLLEDLNATEDPAFAEVTTGFVTGKEPNDIWGVGNEAWIVGDGGYVYWTDDPTGGVTAVDAGSATVDDLLAVHGFSSDFVVAVGKNGAVIYTENGATFATATRPVGVGINLNTVWVKSETEWWVGASNGNLYYTLDSGTTWSTSAFSGSGAGSVHDIVFATGSVGYLSHATAAPRGRIFRTFDGGASWTATPEKTGATLNDNDRLNSLAICGDYDPNFVVGGGLAANGSDGVILVGSA
jgi:photosystem II stability/assembly factor-like uncharacterized protein